MMISFPPSNLLISTSTIMANLLGNGGFENAAAICKQMWCVSTNSAGIAPWVVLSSFQPYEVDSSTAWPAYEGNWSSDLNSANLGTDKAPLGDAAITLGQSVTTVPGATYTLTFQLFQNHVCGPNPKTGFVSATGASPMDFSHTGMKWLPQTYSFLASSTNTIISVGSTTNGTCGPVVDDFNLTLVAPPLPVPIIVKTTTTTTTTSTNQPVQTSSPQPSPQASSPAVTAAAGSSSPTTLPAGQTSLSIAPALPSSIATSSSPPASTITGPMITLAAASSSAADVPTSVALSQSQATFDSSNNYSVPGGGSDNSSHGSNPLIIGSAIGAVCLVLCVIAVSVKFRKTLFLRPPSSSSAVSVMESQKPSDKEEEVVESSSRRSFLKPISPVSPFSPQQPHNSLSPSNVSSDVFFSSVIQQMVDDLPMDPPSSLPTAAPSVRNSRLGSLSSISEESLTPTIPRPTLRKASLAPTIESWPA